jgi:hypothetical protein
LFSVPASLSSALKMEIAESSKRCSPFVKLHGYIFQKAVIITLKLTDKNKLRGFCPRAIYTDRSNAACRRSYCQRLRIKGCRLVNAADPLQPQSLFSRPEPLLFLSSSSLFVLTSLIGPRSRPRLRKSGSAGNRTRISGSVFRNSDH